MTAPSKLPLNLQGDIVSIQDLAENSPVAVKVYLNTKRHSYADGYVAGDPMELASTYTVSPDLDDITLLNAAFDRFNIGEDEIARRYRYAQHRSLSVGDVVGVDRGADQKLYVVARYGWDEIERINVPEHQQECTK